MKWTLSAFHFLYFKNNVAHIKHNPDVSPKLRLQAALNAHFTVFSTLGSASCQRKGTFLIWSSGEHRNSTIFKPSVCELEPIRRKLA